MRAHRHILQYPPPPQKNPTLRLTLILRRLCTVGGKRAYARCYRLWCGCVHCEACERMPLFLLCTCNCIYASFVVAPLYNFKLRGMYYTGRCKKSQISREQCFEAHRVTLPPYCCKHTYIHTFLGTVLDTKDGTTFTLHSRGQE